MLRLIGLGLRDGDISLRGAAAVAAADVAYAELYTNSIDYDLDRLAERTGTAITVLSRSQVEEEDTPLQAAHEQDVAFLVSGDPLVATTHQEIVFRARAAGIDVSIVHAPSILTAVAETGLSSYKFGRVTTLPEPYNGTVPDSPFDVIAANREHGLHTLLLLDIGMPIPDALDHVADRVDAPLLACGRLGTDDATIRYGPADTLQGTEYGTPACLIVPGNLSDNERERLATFKNEPQ